MTFTGCPCGCMTKLPWLDDPDCARHQPAGEPADWPDPAPGHDPVPLARAIAELLPELT